MMMQTSTQKSWHPLLAPALLVLLFAAASLFSILIMEKQKTPTMPNDTAWMEAYLARHQSSELSERQKNIIQNSATITSAVAEDAGVTITLKAVCGNGFTTYYKLDVELPEGMNAGMGDSFEQAELRMNDESYRLNITGGSFRTLEDDNPNDNRYSLLLCTDLDYYEGFNYRFDNGIVRTLHLENIQMKSDNGQLTTLLIEGQWEFGILLHTEGKVVNPVHEPVIVSGLNLWNHTYFEAEISSIAFSEFSLSCKYEATPNSPERIIGINPVVIMKDGRTVRAIPRFGSNHDYRWDLEVLISLDEVAFVKLTDEVVLPIPQK